MPYIPHREEDRKEMLGKIGLDNFTELLKNISPDLTQNEIFDLPNGLSESDLVEKIKKISNENINEAVCFAGAGIYDHYIPSAVHHISARPEFYTAYTPYQPEVSQGTLQAIFEFQSIICELTGMDVANASMYDGATAMTEALIISSRIKKKKKLIISETFHPSCIKVAQTYLSKGFELVICPMKRDGLTDLEKMESLSDSDTAALAVPYVNFYGLIEPIDAFTDLARSRNSLSVIYVNPLTLSVLEPPGKFGADFTVGEGQTLGIEMSYGGPLLGIFACRKEHIRSMPGRIIGETVDKKGERGFVMTLQTREQHIKREKATSNICTNQALCALRAAVHVALMGKEGLENAAMLSHQKAHSLNSMLSFAKNVFPDTPFFNEFAIELPVESSLVIEKMLKNGIIAGVDLGKFDKIRKNQLLVAVTEKRTDKELQYYAELIEKTVKEAK